MDEAFDPGPLRPEPEAPGAPSPTGDEAGARDAPDTVRARLVARFDAWLQAVLAEEEPPTGVAAELLQELEDGPPAEDQEEEEEQERGDRFALWAAMTSLTQEVKLQGRAFSRLSDSVAPIADVAPVLAQNLAAHREALDLARGIAHEALAARGERDTEVARAAERRAQAGLLEALLDARDRLARGLELARTHAAELRKPRGLRRLLGGGRTTRHLRDVTAALERGYALALERLAETLDRLGVHAIECLGRPFDPTTMTAAGVEENPQVADGTVLEIYRTGYARDGETLRPAQVRVARSPAAHNKEPDDERP